MSEEYVLVHVYTTMCPCPGQEGRVESFTHGLSSWRPIWFDKQSFFILLEARLYDEVWNTKYICGFFFKDFIYLFMRDTQREAETQVEGEAGSMQGARCGTRSWDGITP